MQLDPTLLTDYCTKFYGYGRWDAKIWFVGIEEAGGASLETVAQRLSVWAGRGHRDLEDAPTFVPAIGIDTWHGPAAAIQKTWGQLIRMLLLARGLADTNGAILDYQRTRLGSETGDVCFVELLPLPCPKTETWNYNKWTDLPWLASRNHYLQETRRKRIANLKEKVRQYRPKVVIFYGTTLTKPISLLPSWSQIAGGRFDQGIQGKRMLLYRECSGTCFFVTRHPSFETDQYFRQIGNFLGDQWQPLFVTH